MKDTASYLCEIIDRLSEAVHGKAQNLKAHAGLLVSKNVGKHLNQKIACMYWMASAGMYVITWLCLWYTWWCARIDTENTEWN